MVSQKLTHFSILSNLTLLEVLIYCDAIFVRQKEATIFNDNINKLLQCIIIIYSTG
jgi:hypothetical protein